MRQPRVYIEEIKPAYFSKIQDFYIPKLDHVIAITFRISSILFLIGLKEFAKFKILTAEYNLFRNLKNS